MAKICLVHFTRAMLSSSIVILECTYIYTVHTYLMLKHVDLHQRHQASVCMYMYVCFPLYFLATFSVTQPKPIIFYLFPPLPTLLYVECQCKAQFTANCLSQGFLFWKGDLLHVSRSVHLLSLSATNYSCEHSSTY